MSPPEPAEVEVVVNVALCPTSAEFAAGPDTHVAQVMLIRPGVGADQPPASGQVCLADVQWRRIRDEAAPSAVAARAKADKGAAQ